MIPLWIFLFLWIGLASVLSLAALLATIMVLRFGLAGTRTVLITLTFVGLFSAVIFSTTQYALGVDWMQSIQLFTLTETPLY